MKIARRPDDEAGRLRELEQAWVAQVPSMATAKAADRYRSPRERAVAACTTVAPPPVPPSEPPVLTSLVQPLPVAGTERIGVCCSGGGIRSASFNLGALQALQDEGVLDDAEYLSAVSGGSYIAAAWTMVGRTGHPDDSDADLLREQPPFAPRSPEERYLRNRSSYLAPGLVGKVALVWRMLLGLVVNLVSIGLVVVPVGVVVGLFYRSALPVLHTDAAGVELSDVVRTWSWAVPAALAVFGVLVGALGITLSVKLDAVQRFCARWSVRLVLTAVAAAVVCLGFPALLAVLVRTGADAVTEVPASGLVGGAVAPAVVSQASAVTAAVGGGSAITVAVAVLLQLRARLTEPDHVLQTAGTLRTYWQKASSGVRRAFVFVAATVAGPLLLGAGLVLAMYLTVRSPSAPRGVALVAAGALAVYALVYFFGDLTSWSMHPFYRRRLCSAFALKRVRSDPADPASPPTATERDYGLPVRLSQMGRARGPRLVVCAAANISSKGDTAPGRGVTSFTFEQEQLGGPLVGYVGTELFEEVAASRVHDFTLPAAVAMSGAAVSPSMGKMTRRHLTFLLALANVRLGVWVPNPRWAGRWSTTSSARLRPRPSQLWRELLGMNALNGKFLFVSDGGHYENLGLVELLRRGCTEVFCFDASGGSPEAMDSLGDAIALARTELGVEISVDPRPLTPDAETGLAQHDVVTGSITYPDEGRGVRHGRLFYARTVLTDQVPWDLRSIKHSDPRFPNHSTADQLYTDQRFEAYRELGWCAGRRAAALQTAARQAAAPQVAVPQAAPVVAGGAALDGVPQQVVDLDGAAAEADVLDGAARPVDA
ncbi:patatin-like phospholipase family protein [Angustibacter aerolatus]